MVMMMDLLMTLSRNSLKRYIIMMIINLAVDFPHGGSSCPLHQIGIWNVSFCRGKKIRGCGEKPSEPGQEPTTRCQVLQSNPGHSRGRQALLSREALIISNNNGFNLAWFVVYYGPGPSCSKDGWCYPMDRSLSSG